MPDWYIPLRNRVRAVTIVFGAMAVALSVAVGFGFVELRLLDRIIAGDDVTDAEINANLARLDALFWVTAGLTLLAIIVFVRWMRAAYQNVDAVPHSDRRYGLGWAIGGWFVPILAFWRPKQIANDIWWAGGAGDRRPSGLLALWWLLWLLSGVVLRVAQGSYNSAQTPEELRTGTIIYLVGDALMLVAAVLAIAVVRISSERLDEQASKRPEPLPPEHPDGAVPPASQPVGAIS